MTDNSEGYPVTGGVVWTWNRQCGNKYLDIPFALKSFNCIIKLLERKQLSVSEYFWYARMSVIRLQRSVAWILKVLMRCHWKIWIMHLFVFCILSEDLLLLDNISSVVKS